jgi:hypothetical protein
MSKTSSPLRRGLGLVAGCVLSLAVSAVVAMPVADAQCNTVGQTASQQVQGYLDRHPDVKARLQAKSQAEGSNGNLVDYLNRHPDVRDELVTLANKCTP